MGLTDYSASGYEATAAWTNRAGYETTSGANSFLETVGSFTTDGAEMGSGVGLGGDLMQPQGLWEGAGSYNEEVCFQSNLEPALELHDDSSFHRDAASRGDYQKGRGGMGYEEESAATVSEVDEWDHVGAHETDRDYVMVSHDSHEHGAGEGGYELAGSRQEHTQDSDYGTHALHESYLTRHEDAFCGIKTQPEHGSPLDTPITEPCHELYAVQAFNRSRHVSPSQVPRFPPSLTLVHSSFAHPATPMPDLDVHHEEAEEPEQRAGDGLFSHEEEAPRCSDHGGIEA